jgi:hypothetical protein
MASVIRRLCQQRGLVGRRYYAAMASYRAAGRLSDADRTTLRGMTETERRTTLDQRYAVADISLVALADFDSYPVRPTDRTR